MGWVPPASKGLQVQPGGSRALRGTPYSAMTVKVAVCCTDADAPDSPEAAAVTVGGASSHE